MGDVIKIIVENGISIILSAILVLYVARKLLKQEPQESKQVIENNTQALTKVADALDRQSNDTKDLKAEVMAGRLLNEKILTTNSIIDEKCDIIIRLNLKEGLERAEEIIQEVEGKHKECDKK